MDIKYLNDFEYVFPEGELEGKTFVYVTVNNSSNIQDIGGCG